MGGRSARNFPSPLDTLLPYGRRWIDDAARFKIACWARQTGKSWHSALEAVRDCIERKTTWVCLSAGERQALEWMRKAREHSEAFRVALSWDAEERERTETLLKAAEIRWPNGSRLIAIPANPDTARGYSANLVLDEFAFHERPDDIWRAIFPSISNPLRGPLKIRVLSTPNGLNNRFADLWLKAEGWSRHKLTIHDAVREGLPVDVEELRRGLNDPEGWAQEYECEFADTSAVLLPYELIATCEHPEATETCPPEFWEPSARRNPLWLGVDFGRSRDLTVCWAWEQIGDVLWTREVLVLDKMPTPRQVEHLSPRIRAARRCCLDYTGPGVGLGDYLAERFGEYDPAQHKFGRVELCKFTNELKVDIFPKLRMAMEKQRVRLPVSRAVREDLHAVSRVTTPGGQITYRAPHTADGHSDRCVAAALGLRAAGTVGAGAFTAETVRQISQGGTASRGVYHPRPLVHPTRRGGRMVLVA